MTRDRRCLLGGSALLFALAPSLLGLGGPPAIVPSTTVEWGPRVLSHMGPDGDNSHGGFLPKAAYTPSENEYLVVWCGDDGTPPLVDDEFEVFGQRIDAGTGEKVGDRIRISFMGTDGDPAYQGCHSSVGQWFTRVDLVYNSAQHEYLVVWSGDGSADEKFEIFGQRIDAATGARKGGNFKIGSMGPEGDSNYDAFNPAVAYNSTDHQYLVVWSGDDNTAPQVNNEFEIFGQRLDATSGEKLGDRLAISEQGYPIATWRQEWDARFPDVAYGATDNQYLVVWEGADSVAPGDWPFFHVWFEIFAQRLDADGSEIGEDDQISLMTSSETVHLFCYNSACRQGFEPAVTYNQLANEYLVVWRGDDYELSGGFEHEVHGQRIAASTGAEVGRDDFQISSMGPDETSSAHDAYSPDVRFNPAIGEYLVVWWADDDTGTLLDDEFEIFGQRLTGVEASESGEDDFRISAMGPDADTEYGASHPAVVANTGSHETVVVWHGDDDVPPFVNDEYEVWAECRGVPGPCGAAADLDLFGMILWTHRTFSACATITARDGFQVAQNGNVTFIAGGSITIGNGFSVLSLGQFRAVLGSP